MKNSARNPVFPTTSTRSALLDRRLFVTVLCAITLGLAHACSALDLGQTRSAWVDRPTKTVSGRTSLKNSLAAFRAGRIVLHAMCLIRNPEKATWHWQGILREITA